MFDKLNALQQVYAEAQQKVRSEGLEALKAAFRDFFARFPAARAIRWRQYTPYFNDGDACCFSVHSPGVRLDDESEEGDYEDGFLSSWALKSRDPELHGAFSKLSELLQSDTLEPVLKAVFGDHVLVTATPEEIESESYDHD